MKHYRNFLCLLLAAVMLTTLFVPLCFAAGASKTAGLYDIILPPDTFDDPDPMDVYTDVQKGSWYYNAVSYMVQKGYMTGTSKTTFAPNKGLTRAEFVMVLYKVLGGKPVSISNPFNDVKKGSWYYDAVLWAYSKKITSGTTANTFSPDAPVTREQVAVFLYSAFGKSGPAPDKSYIRDYSDWKNVSDWAVTAMDWAIMKGCISGVKDANGKVTLSPKKTATRAELAVIISKMK